ncbi:MAG: phosphoribosylformylglycinamidine cyclo-ligase [candidate division FCPU426 bacterium]
MRKNPPRKPAPVPDAYAAAGVNIDAGNETVRRIKAHVHSTRTPEVLADVGSFGGLFKLPGGFKQPVLVASTDGVGTKIMIAAAIGRYDTIGQDLVNHCVNDILVQGARPLFFLDYFATGKLDPKVVEQVVKGLAQACRENKCALLGGETAEMPGLYKDEDFDLAGTIVGAVDRSRVIDGKSIKPGDVIIGLPSTGLHTNGYSLARKIFFSDLMLTPKTVIPELGLSVTEALMAVHKSYLPAVWPLLKKAAVKGLAHITGGGFLENIPRILPQGTGAVIRKGSWPVLPVFSFMAQKAKLPEPTMYRTFNMGIGMVAIVSKSQAPLALKLLKQNKEKAYVIGEIGKGKREVKLV